MAHSGWCRGVHHGCGVCEFGHSDGHCMGMNVRVKCASPGDAGSKCNYHRACRNQIRCIYSHWKPLNWSDRL